jgi:NitT/TauT family transport system substrate-binding protein
MGFTKLAALLAIAAGLTGPALAEVSELRITRQPSTVYLPLILMEQQKLVEKKTREAGLGDVKVSWLTFSSGGASTDALMSGNVDLVTSGVSNLLLLWDRTRGEVKGVAGASAVPMVLVTRNPAVKTLADFSEKDRIAVPTVKVSMQAIVLQIAAEKAFGEAGRNKLDAITIQLGHPDAAIALANPRSEVNSHFSLPPFLNFELADPNIHKVVNSSDVMGGPVSNGVIFGTRKFQEANPKLMAAFRAALDEAMSLIKNDPRQAAEIYLAATREKISVDELAKIIGDKESVYSAAPQNTMKIADHLHKSGVIKRAAETWKDFFFADVHALPGS